MTCKQLIAAVQKFVTYTALNILLSLTSIHVLAPVDPLLHYQTAPLLLCHEISVIGHDCYQPLTHALILYDKKIPPNYTKRQCEPCTKVMHFTPCAFT